ncbi:MAG: transporter substrate-binding domain-containing protein [Balneolaceae bacterium]|nr:transporter substrate-binding domain-containing protein [Balneolaceae bacterium]
MHTLANRLSSGFLYLLLSSALIVTGCAGEGPGPPGDDGLNVKVPEPQVDRDWADIKESGVLRMITRYSSNTYFLHQGLEWGFEYELVNEFVREHDLALDVVIVGPGENPYDLLNSGEGDLIAGHYTVTPERRRYVTFTRPYNLVNQLLVYSDRLTPQPSSVEELASSEVPITIKRNSSYFSRLQELRNDGREVTLQMVPGEKDTESLLFDVSQGDYLATVADNNIFQATNRYMPGLVRGPTIARDDSVAWAIRKNAPDLETQLNRYLYKHFRLGGPDEPPKRSAFLNILRKRYFENSSRIAEYHSPESAVSGSGIISPYDGLIREVADSAGIDWLWIASIIAQETKFNPDSESWAGAVGLMQVMPRFSQVEDREMLYNEEVNVREGVRIISEHLEHYAYMDSTNQWAFALATYNAGMGHVADARRLAVDLNRDPNQWANVEDAFLKLMQRQYYKDARYGFCRGIETVRYVKEVMNRYRTYESILAMADHNRQVTEAGMGGVFSMFREP